MKYALYLFALLLVPTFGYSNTDKKPNMFKHYATHIATDAGAHLVAAACILSGFVTASAFDQRHPAGRVFAGTSALSGIAAALYTFYKTPEWTDEYILKYKNERSGGQNFLTFICRIFLPFPLGTIVGELGVENDLVVA